MTTETLIRYHFSAAEYARMHETGIFTEDDRVELLDGEIYTMAPIGPLHAGLVNKLNRIFTQLAADTAIVSVQNPIRLNDFSEPQPDIAILHPRADFYSNALPVPDDVLVLIEIADASLNYDREQKLPRYARDGIREVWIVDVNKHVIEQYTRPNQGEYTQLHKIIRGNQITAAALPQVSFSTDLLF